MYQDRLNEKHQILAEVFGDVDRDVLVVLKGHLLIEESLNNIIENFIYHPDKLKNANLSFYQKIHIAKSMSIAQENNTMWQLIEKLNSLRNDFAHNLTSDKRNHKIQDIRKLYEDEVKGSAFENDWYSNDLATFISLIVSFCLGFLTSFEVEVEKKRSLMKILNRAL